MKDIGGICELWLSLSCAFGMRLHAAATKLVHSVVVAGTRGHRGRLVQPVRSAELHGDRLIRCDAGPTGTYCNHASGSTNDCKSPLQLWGASFTITAGEIHIDTFRIRFHRGIGLAASTFEFDALCVLAEFNGAADTSKGTKTSRADASAHARSVTRVGERNSLLFQTRPNFQACPHQP
jgi:hypothetical protein